MGDTPYAHRMLLLLFRCDGASRQSTVGRGCGSAAQRRLVQTTLRFARRRFLSSSLPPFSLRLQPPLFIFRIYFPFYNIHLSIRHLVRLSFLKNQSRSGGRRCTIRVGSRATRRKNQPRPIHEGQSAHPT